MKNYRRLSGDGSVKVVLSGDFDPPPKTTSRREPPSYNSPPTQELRTSVPVGGEVTNLTYPAERPFHLGRLAPRQNVDCGACDSDLGNSLVILPGRKVPWTLDIRGYVALPLQKIKFSVSATLKQPSLQMKHLHQISTETNKKY
jgi:hypothetical protein